MGELTASLAHEILHPIATARNNARAGMRLLDRTPPDLGEVKEALSCVVRDADRAKDIVGRVREHVKKAPPRKEPLDINEAIDEVIVMARGAIVRNKVSMRAFLREELNPIQGDRVQLQQVVLNLVLNAVEAMNSVEEGARELSESSKSRRAALLWKCAIRDRASIGIVPSGFLNPSTRRRPAESGWGWRSAVPSSSPTGVGCGWTLMSLKAPYSGSPCRQQSRPMDLSWRLHGWTTERRHRSRWSSSTGLPR
jgi:hypothetical protein